MIQSERRIDFDIGCEECGIIDEIVYGIIEGKSKRLCKRCANINGAIIFPSKENRQIEIKKIEPNKEKEKKEFTFSDLYQRFLEIKNKKQKENKEVLDENKFLKDMEKEQSKEIEEIKKAVAGIELEFDFKPERIKNMKVRDLLEIAKEKKINQ